MGAVLLGILGVTACSSSNTAAACDSSQCAAGNKCLPLNGEVKCRKTCSSNTDPTASCPFGYTCVSTDPEPFCVKDTSGVTKTSKGWGTPCVASDGLDHNKACDTDQNFWCFGESNTDGNAYCTRYDCTADTDCGAGFYCATHNVFPDVTTTKRSTGDTEKVCLKRDTFCTPCKADLDCLPIKGKASHCVADDSGASFCTPECELTENCNNEAKCLDFGDFKACYPRAGVCVGDGSICSPCRSDGDCGADGLCIKGQYTTEKFCAKKSPSACGGKDCPAKPGNLPSASTGIGCQKTADDTVPAGYCVGVYNIGGQAADVGCYTPER